MQRTKKAKYKKAKNKLAKDLKAKVQKSKSLISKRWFSIGIQKIKVQCKEVTAGVVPIGKKKWLDIHISWTRSGTDLKFSGDGRLYERIWDQIKKTK